MYQYQGDTLYPLFLFFSVFLSYFSPNPFSPVYLYLWLYSFLSMTLFILLSLSHCLCLVYFCTSQSLILNVYVGTFSIRPLSLALFSLLSIYCFLLSLCRSLFNDCHFCSSHLFFCLCFSSLSLNHVLALMSFLLFVPRQVPKPLRVLISCFNTGRYILFCSCSRLFAALHLSRIFPV